MKHVRRWRRLAAFYLLLWLTNFAPGGQHTPVASAWRPTRPLVRRADQVPWAALRPGPDTQPPGPRLLTADVIVLGDPVVAAELPVESHKSVSTFVLPDGSF